MLTQKFSLWAVLCGLIISQSSAAVLSTVVEGHKAASQPLPIDQWTGKRLMFMYAHIDDMECSSGGTLALLSGKAEVHLLIMTNGDKGCGNPDLCGNLTNEELASLRQEEQRNSAALLDIPPENVDFLGLEDCELNMASRQEVQRQVVTVLRQKQPDIVFTWDPSPRFEMTPSLGWGDLGYHPDHQVSGRLSLDAVYMAHLSRMWPELGEAWRVEAMYFWAYTPSRVPDFYVDITAQDVYARKQAAFLQMHSQYKNPADITDFLEFTAVNVGATVGLPEGSLAEGYDYILW
mmetsp:Transcript_18298/g.30515  ORF Transcript_18298/g.30515 Transcript_18298/m.30515 type:complete len:291 (-) Transcript_18298:925-1797(-)